MLLRILHTWKYNYDYYIAYYVIFFFSLLSNQTLCQSGEISLMGMQFELYMGKKIMAATSHFLWKAEFISSLLEPVLAPQLSNQYNVVSRSDADSSKRAIISVLSYLLWGEPVAMEEVNNPKSPPCHEEAQASHAPAI